MKNSFSLLTLVLFLSSNLLAQNRKSFSPPRFIDSNKFFADLSANRAVKDYFNFLKTQKEYAIYKYDFKIMPSGKIVQGLYDSPKTINSFIKRNFNRYKWISAYKGKRKVKAYGSLHLSFIPLENRIHISLLVDNGASKLSEIIDELIIDRDLK